MTGLGLHDVWKQTSTRPSITLYTSRGASRIDRIYINHTLKPMKGGVATVVAGFTDNLALVLQMASGDPIPTRGRGYWQMNTAVLQEVGFCQLLRGKWET